MMVSVSFVGEPDGLRGKALNSIMLDRGARRVSSGYFLPTGETDVQFKFEDADQAIAAVDVLKKAGFEDFEFKE